MVTATMDMHSQKTSIWMGDLEPWMTEEYLRNMWFSIGENVHIKLMKDKYTGASNYCFVDFQTNVAAHRAIQTLNGTLMPNSNRPFRLNWASGGGAQDTRREDQPPEYPIFVGDLGSEVDDMLLLSSFKSIYASTKNAKVITDPNTGMSRGYGFVRFLDEVDQQRALVEMQGQMCGSRPMRISVATPRNKGPYGSAGHHHPAHHGGAQQHLAQYYSDPNNTTVFVGGLLPIITDDDLRNAFSPFGEITFVKIPPGKGCGFVTFMHRHAAEMAIANMTGVLLNGARLRVGWGRSHNDKYSAARAAAAPMPMYGGYGYGGMLPPQMGGPPQHPYGAAAGAATMRPAGVLTPPQMELAPPHPQDQVALQHGSQQPAA